MPKVSICVPVYNVERYISRCLNSLINQSLEDIEIIVVNDCTPDKSMDIVRDYCSRDKRIKVLQHETNKGLMTTRKTGYLNAVGDYVTFCDSDDSLPCSAIEMMYEAALASEADIISGVIQYVRTDGEKVLWSSSLNYGTDSLGIYKSLLNRECGHNVCSKLFKRDLLQHYSYNTYDHFTNGEDGCLFYQVVANCNRMYQIANVTYNYYQNTDSSSHIRYSHNSIYSIGLLNKTRVEVCSKYPQIYTLLYSYVSSVLNDLFYKGYNADGYLMKTITDLGLEDYIKPIKMIKYLNTRDLFKLLIKRYFIKTH